MILKNPHVYSKITILSAIKLRSTKNSVWPENNPDQPTNPDNQEKYIKNNTAALDHLSTSRRERK